MNLRQTIYRILAIALLGASCAPQSGAAAPAPASVVAPTPPPAGNHAAGLAASPEADWPEWRGKYRDGICDETGLLPSWPEGGPKLLWKVDSLGKGWSSPIVVAGTLYITGDVGNDLVLYAYDLEGKLKWKATNGESWKGSYPGARACCALSEGRLYHMNAHGRAACLDPATGKELWAVNVLREFDAKNITWAIAECLLVDGPRLIVTPGGAKAAMAALDKTTGKTLWASAAIEGDRAAYSSPILFEYGGLRHLVNFTSRHGVCVDADTGRLLWTVPYKNRFDVNVSTPTYADGDVFLVAPDGPGGTLYRLKVNGKDEQAEKAWASPLDTLTGGTLLVEGGLYGAGYASRALNGWMGVDWKTGQARFTTRDIPSGSAIWADGRMYILSESGPLWLVKPTPTGFDVCGRVTLVAGKHNDVWAHPVLCDGRLYLRYHDTLWCYDVRAK